MKRKTIALFFIALVLISSLVNVDFFGSLSLSAYFFYITSVGLLATLTGALILKDRIMIPRFNSLPLVLFTLFVAYYFLQSVFFSNRIINTVHIYILGTGVLFFCVIILLKINLVSKKHLYRLVFSAAIIEALICLAQAVNFIPGLNKYLPVSGTWVNPNVTAIFLAMAVPLTFDLFISEKKRFKYIYAFSLLIIVSALWLLKCRTALFGSLLSIFLLLNYHFQYWKLLKQKAKSLHAIFVISCMLLLAIPSFYYINYTKQSSTLGRKVIWKISTSMIAENPLFGFGYGTFEFNYNFHQAKYFESGKGLPIERETASFTTTAYNEFIQNSVEGGVIGLVLFSSFLVSLLVSGVKSQQKDNNDWPPLDIVTAKTGIVAFTCMSCLNFTVQAIPAMVVFIVYAAIIASAGFQAKNPLSPKIISYCISIVLIVIGLNVFILQSSSAASYSKTNKAQQFIERKENAEAIAILDPLEESMKNSQFFWNTYGKAIYNKKQYREALKYFQNASAFSNNPNTLLSISSCYVKLQSYDSAISVLTLVTNIIPNLLAPKYSLLKAYEKTNDSINARRIAVELIEMKPKGISQMATFYKQEAINYLNKNKN